MPLSHDLQDLERGILEDEIKATVMATAPEKSIRTRWLHRGLLQELLGHC
jgi:hypothetical protein